MKSRERLTDLLLSFDEGAVIHGYRVSGDTIELIGENGQVLKPSYAAIGSGYERDSGKFKSTTQVVADPERMSGNVPDWLNRYDRLFAVDTNTVDLDSQKLCVTCCVRTNIKFAETNTWNGSIEPLEALVIMNPHLKPELIGWLDVLGRINSDPTLRVGLVVDSELGSIPEFNLRKIPIVDDIFLPENVELIYASSGHDRNLPFNFLIAKCDADASLLLEKIRKDRSRLSALQLSNGTRYESSYYWQPKKNVV